MILPKGAKVPNNIILTSAGNYNHFSCYVHLKRSDDLPVIFLGALLYQNKRYTAISTHPRVRACDLVPTYSVKCNTLDEACDWLIGMHLTENL